MDDNGDPLRTGYEFGFASLQRLYFFIVDAAIRGKPHEYIGSCFNRLVNDCRTMGTSRDMVLSYWVYEQLDRMNVSEYYRDDLHALFHVKLYNEIVGDRIRLFRKHRNDESRAIAAFHRYCLTTLRRLYIDEIRRERRRFDAEQRYFADKQSREDAKSRIKWVIGELSEEKIERLLEYLENSVKPGSVIEVMIAYVVEYTFDEISLILQAVFGRPFKAPAVRQRFKRYSRRVLPGILTIIREGEKADCLLEDRKMKETKVVRAILGLRWHGLDPPPGNRDYNA